MIAEFANGDARVALNTLEMAVLNANHHNLQVNLTIDSLKQLINTKLMRQRRYCALICEGRK